MELFVFFQAVGEYACDAVEMAYTLVYVQFLGFVLRIQVGSDFYLFRARCHIALLSLETSSSDNSVPFPERQPSFGTFTFTKGTPLQQMNIIDGCNPLFKFTWCVLLLSFPSRFITVPLRYSTSYTIEYSVIFDPEVIT